VAEALNGAGAGADAGAAAERIKQLPPILTITNKRCQWNIILKKVNLNKTQQLIPGKSITI
jgi:hypothetical protein